MLINTLRPRQNGRHFADDTFKRIFLKENVRVSIKISVKFVPKSRIDNIPALFQIMAWRQPGDKPLSEAMMVSLLCDIMIHITSVFGSWCSDGTVLALTWTYVERDLLYIRYKINTRIAPACLCSYLHFCFSILSGCILPKAIPVVTVVALCRMRCCYKLWHWVFPTI